MSNLIDLLEDFLSQHYFCYLLTIRFLVLMARWAGWKVLDSGMLLYPTIVLEIILPLFIIVGYKAQLSAGLLAIFCIATAFIFHFDFNDQMQTISFLKNIGLAGGFLFIVANGTKEWAIERKKVRKTIKNPQ